MTEETKKDSSNLCTTLDDFEKFQSVSMYEEDEFITLSDIVSPRAEPSHQPSDISEIPYDNEVVLSTNMDDQDEVNNISETGKENNICVEAPPVTATESSDAQQPSEDVINVNTPILPKPRGRKKKSLPIDETFESPCKSEADVLKPVRGTRTRKPKVIYNEEEMFAEKTPKKTTPTNDITEQISSAELNNSASQRRGRRGRPKKVVPNESLPLGGETNGQLVKKTPGKRGRPKKRSLTDFDLNETQQPSLETVQPMELVSPSDIGTALNESIIQEPEAPESNPEQHGTEECATEEHASNNLPVKKKGRKHGISKKAPLEPLVTDNDQQIGNKTEQQSNLDDCDEDGDDISLSQLKQKCDTNASNVEPDFIVDDIEDLGFEPLLLEHKPTDIVPNTTETVVNEEPTVEQVNNNDTTNNSLLVEDTSKRPVRRKAKQTLHYDEGSDEDPYANMESESDDEPIGKRKSKRYNSDDEYVPGSKREKLSSSDASDSDIDDIELEELTSNKRKRSRKMSDLRSPNKKVKPEEPFKDIHISTIVPTSNALEDDDVEVCLQSSVIKANTSDDSRDSKKNVWGMSNEFESFLAKKIHSTDLKIKKVSKEQPQSTPLEIPVLSTEAKRRVDMSCQTTKTVTKAVSVQTATNEVPMKDNVPLTPKQSEKACEFLKSIVKTTSELGQLMTQKSDDFITKKINTEHVTNTFKMDYCVKKSFLLLKLAKHNLIQMEDDLSKQYEEFLKTNGLSSCREEIKVIAPAPKPADSDSDCEIVDEQPAVKTEKGKPKFNPKTVFLNKELSIKIAKKNPPPPPSVIDNKSKEKLNAKGRHTVWISDSVMVKKVKPTQSFLAQDSRNKKPPDSHVTEKMVSDFFENYYRQKVLSICAPFTSREWLGISRSYVCSYFFVKSDKFCNTDSSHAREDFFLNNSENTTIPETSDNGSSVANSPETLFSLCTQTLQKHLSLLGSVVKENEHPMSDENSDLKERTPESLFRLCLKSLIATDSMNENYTNDEKVENELFQVAIEGSSSMCVNKDTSATTNNDEAFDEPNTCVNEYFSITNDENNETFQVLSLQSMCHKKIIDLICEDNLKKKEDQLDPIMDLIWETDPSQKEDNIYTNVDKICESNTNMEDKMYPIISENEQIHKLLTSRIEDISCYDFNENDLDLNISFKKGNKNGIKSLFSLCVKFIQRRQKSVLPRSESNIRIDSSPNSCMEGEFYPIISEQIPKKWLRSKIDDLSCNGFDENNLDLNISTKHGHKNGIKSLFSLCVKSIQRQEKSFLPRSEQINQINYSPNSLKQIAMENINYSLNRVKLHNLDDNLGNITSVERLVTQRVKRLASICFENITPYFVNDDVDQANKHNLDEFTINSVNTLSEEAFHNMQMTCQEEQEHSQYLEDEEAPYDNDNDYDGDFEQYEEENHVNEELLEENNIEENSWVSQVQMKELKSCFIPSAAKNVGRQSLMNEGNERLQLPVIAQIKIEPEIEEEASVDPSIVKTEPVCDLDEMVSIPENVITKKEIIEEAGNPKVPIQRHNSSSYNEDTFETFVRSNKMLYEMEETPNTAEEIFSQSALRVRRQYEPDPDGENYEDDSSMNLLIPHTFEPLNIETAKDSLMESSSDDEGSSKKVTGKKKSDKKGRGRPKKSDTKQNNKDATPAAKEKEKPAPPAENELTVLTRRMREKIRQEEKKIESSDSETEKLPLASRKEKDRKDNSGKLKPEDLPLQLRKEMDRKENDKSKLSKSNKKVENEIQCNSVDSTQQTDGNVKDTNRANTENDQQFTGFSAVDQNEMYSYQKYVKYVYDQILPKVISEENNVKQPLPQVEDPASIIPDDHDRSNSPLINPDEPIEMLECEPTMPSFEDFEPEETKKITRDNKPRPKSKKTKAKDEDSKAPEVTKAITPVFTERDGWQCYPIGVNETKLYQKAEICLEKLPESFVETYFEYQNITDKNTEDAEVDRLTNLNSLNRSSNLKEVKTRPKPKDRSDELTEQSNVSRPSSPAHSDHYNELEPSEDEGANVDDEVPPPVPLKSSENSLAKNSLMNDDDSETELLKIKQELDDSSELKDRPKKTKGPKTSPVLPTSEHPELLMLTADKSMNKELNLLHAPVLKDEIPETSKGPATRNKNKSITKSRSPRDKTAPEDDSSSEEEKQWVSTKEKLLKRMGKNKDTTRLDDAKRAKLVTEFIERRADMPDTRKRGLRGRRSRKLSRKILEREKQLRVLSHELFGDALTDATHAGKASSQSFFKGRRNIRKVIDKKSLARSTVVANMEEFERKCRLNQRQTRLRELLGCEEGVNVLVINDEVCLEYDFEEHQPVVTVHPFFTKVMKAHQYEGVKFMWDACFESLEKIESGHSGGGCILAHCMGLGKTLQVLALLHTVLTHPRVGMQRVLVCCPLSTVLNWVDEIHKWIGPVTDQIKVFELSKLRKTYERAYQLEDWYSGGGIFIIGYELFRSLSTLDPELDDIRPTIINKIRTALLDPGPDIIVCDEGHLLKNDCSVLSVAMSRVMTKRRIVLTGTPMQNNLREYYCMVNFVKPNLLGTYSEYSNRFENPIMNGQHRDSIEEDIKLMKQRTHILHKVLEGCLQRQEASVLYPYLPKKHEYTVFISLTACQWDLYRHYINNYTKQSKQKASILKDFHILQKIWSHPQVLHRFQMRTRDADGNKIKPEKLEDDLANEDLTATEDMKPADTEVWWLQYLEGGNMLDSLESSHKFAVVFRILDECIALGDKVLIFSTSLITMDSLEYFLRKINNWSLGQEYFRLDGSVPPEVRQKWCREFNAEHNEKTKLFLISTRAGSLGLNMVAANRVIILDTSWNPAHDIQSIFRVYRFGQKKDCYIYRLVAMGTMEQKIYERSVTKQAVSCRVVDEQQIDRHYNMAELTELYRFDDEGVSVAGGLAVGVTDVALLRVARHAGLHAVHEHDSLLRGSSEQCLPEHERAAAWMQFQQEHAHKQMQNQLTSSFSLHIPMKTLEQVPAPGSFQLPAIKSENWLQNNYEEPPEKQPNKQKKGKRLKALKEPTNHHNLPQPDELPTNQEALDIENGMVKKIMDILVKHKFQTEGPKEIAALVSNVRKIVAYGRVPEGSFNKELTESIANVLLGKDPPMPALTDVLPVEKKRGRPRKIKQVEQYAPIEAPKEEIIDTGGRRRAAIAAEKQLSTIKDSVIEIDCDDDWQADSDYAPDEIEPEASTSKPPEPTVKKEKDIQQETKKQLNTEICSILLSDDDEPTPPPKQKTKTSKKTVEAKKDDGEAVPLHPSLLSNKNFVKIVAHTYLEGNPMLDEDAAMLAAQYSTQKALKEFESLGKPIFSGPIYDIAIQVLGKEILQKLHKTNPVLKKTETATPEKANIKTEPSTSSEKKAPRVKAKGLAELTGKQMPGLGYAKQVAGTPESLQSPSVVPVGLFKSAAGMSMTTEEPLPSTSQPKEESILPDDDDVIIGDSAVAPGRRNSQPLILNSVSSKVTGKSPKLKPMTIKISSGQIIRPNMSAPQTMTINAPQTMAINAPQVITLQSGVPTLTTPAPAPSHHQDTICLDSDDEETITPNVPPTPPPPIKRIALKSTAKIVPISLADANSHHASIPLMQNPVFNTQVINSSQLANKKGYVVIPASSLTRLQPGATIPENAKCQKLHRLAQPPTGVNLLNQQTMSQVVTSLPQNTNNAPYPMTLTSNPNYIASEQNVIIDTPPQNAHATPIRSTISGPRFTILPNNLQPRIPQSIPQTMHSQNMNYINSMSQPINLNEINSIPQQSTPINTNVTNTAPESILPNRVTSKTVCKPGDILHITKTGEVKILNRGVEDATNTSIPSIVPDQAPVNTVTLDDDSPNNTMQYTGKSANTVTLDDDPPTKTSQEYKGKPPATPVRDERPNTRQHRSTKPSSPKRSRILSSSSSSDSSRSSSPKDPLDILKDVVHIKAADDFDKLNAVKTDSRPKSNTQPLSKDSGNKSTIGNTTITKSYATKTPSTTPKSTPSKTNQPVKPSDKLMDQINKTDSILKKLNSFLGPSDKQKTAQTRRSTARSDSPVIESVDLTEPSISKSTSKSSSSLKSSASTSKSSSSLLKSSASTSKSSSSLLKSSASTSKSSSSTSKSSSSSSKPTSSKPSSSTSSSNRKVLSLLSKDIQVGKTESKPKSSSSWQTEKKEAKTISGTSKNIIISGSGKASSLAPADSAKKNVRVTSVEKIAPAAPIHKPWSDSKKRPAASTETNAPKKKKTELMTLKDFNIDDIDDIIELE